MKNLTRIFEEVLREYHEQETWNSLNELENSCKSRGTYTEYQHRPILKDLHIEVGTMFTDADGDECCIESIYRNEDDSSAISYRIIDKNFRGVSRNDWYYISSFADYIEDGTFNLVDSSGAYI